MKNSLQPEEIGVVVVTYHPSAEDLAQTEALKEHYAVAVVDNTAENRGIAMAQNMGIGMLPKAVRYVIFLDQDSRVETDYPLQIATRFSEISASGKKLAMLGPQVCYAETGAPYKSVFHADKAPENGFVPRREIISSGSCTTMDVLQDVGLPEEGLFIDFVDFEWCWRAESKGYVCGIVPEVKMLHKVGQKELHIGQYRVIVSAAYRYYYQYRNHRLLSKRSYVPGQWKRAMWVKHLARLVYLPLAVENGKEIRKAMWRGLKAGRRG